MFFATAPPHQINIMQCKIHHLFTRHYDTFRRGGGTVVPNCLYGRRDSAHSGDRKCIYHFTPLAQCTVGNLVLIIWIALLPLGCISDQGIYSEIPFKRSFYFLHVITTSCFKFHTPFPTNCPIKCCGWRLFLPETSVSTGQTTEE